MQHSTFNLYVYCIDNSVRYIDLKRYEAGDPFKLIDDTEIAFVETTNGKSIKEKVEYYISHEKNDFF